MPIYEYEHVDMTQCGLGHRFDIRQAISDLPLTYCPECGMKVQKQISLIHVNTHGKTNAELRDLGFTKLVKRDDGVYENVTHRGSESRYVLRDQPETMPNLSKTIQD
ncbi:MAG: zinc ribbon domain-containing protein [Desulfobacterales bacterium]|nr:zinc ribbon domain-containing protein [Desulfobacterales bacterium]